jgi:hypothetical protein
MTTEEKLIYHDKRIAVLYKRLDALTVNVNALVNAVFGGAPPMPCVLARDATARAMANAAYTDMIFSIVDLDRYGEYNNATGLYTATRPGIYLTTWGVVSDIYGWNALEYWETGVSKNNSTAAGNYKVGSQWQCQVNGNYFASSIGCVPVSAVAGETIRIKVYQNRGAATDTYDDSTYNYFNIYRLP